MPTCALQWKSTPSASICSMRRSMIVLLHLEVGNAVAQQAAGLGVLLEDVHLVAGARELLGAGKPRRARADDRDRLPVLRRAAAPAGSSLPRSRGRRSRTRWS